MKIIKTVTIRKAAKVNNFRKAYYYMKKNGMADTFYAVLERMVMGEDTSSYCYRAPGRDVLEKQKAEGDRYSYRFSILVPAYETKEEYLREMMDSVLGQSYGNLELIIADASRSERVENVVRTYADGRIRYLSLPENKGISENTNRALEEAQGDYVGLLDHDDVLAPDALYEMASAINRACIKQPGGNENDKNGISADTPWLLYSDEDKCNGEMTEFYEPHRKPGLDVDLLLSNNYICHFMVMKRELMQELRFRREYDGAQDYDMVLRAVGKLLYGGDGPEAESAVSCGNGAAKKRCRGCMAGRNAVVHVPKVLYHWRCHSASTAENPESKRYAYEAGKRALEDFLRSRNWKGTVSHTKHLGFYRIAYEGGIFAQREDVGVAAGPVYDRGGRICGGAYGRKGNVLYRGLYKHFSGYMHRAVLYREVYAADLRRMRVRKELWQVFGEVFGMPYREGRDGWFDVTGIKGDGADLRRQCLEFGRRVRRLGYTVVWLPRETGRTGRE